MKKRGGLFDFNGDGKESFFERALAYKMFQEFMKSEDEEEDHDEFFDDDLGIDDWRDFCDDADDYDLDPYDFDTQEEYEEAREEKELEDLFSMPEIDDEIEDDWEDDYEDDWEDEFDDELW